MAQRIEIVRGTTNTFAITVTDANNDLYTLADGEVIKFGIKRKKEDADPIFVKTAITGENGVYAIVLAPSDTAELPCGKYMYDVGLQSGGAYHSIIEPNVFEILPNVTEWGEES